MKANQVSIRNGIEDILFPMSICHITQGNNVGTHAGSYAADLIGNGSKSEVAYFPFSAICKAIGTRPSEGNAVFWESLQPVRFADGTIDYATIMVLHDNDLSGISIGVKYGQGRQMAQVGIAGNATGYHLHIEFGRGKFTHKYNQNSYGVYYLPNNLSIDNACFMDDTVIKVGSGNWKYIKDVVVTNNTLSGKTLFLPANVQSWRVYPLNLAPIVGNECGYLRPAKFGGLSYQIIGNPFKDVVTIQTRDYNKVNIYVAKSTGAVIK